MMRINIKSFDLFVAKNSPGNSPKNSIQNGRSIIFISHNDPETMKIVQKKNDYKCKGTCFACDKI